MNLRTLFNDTIDDLFDALEPHETRLVGGYVRDFLATGRKSDDVDIATTAPPHVVTEKLKQAGFSVIPTGLKHGTVTAKRGDALFEVTTLRRDMTTDGRRAKVIFTLNFEEDAIRRDFTFNALYVAKDGTLYDYHGGEDDLKAGLVHFIGDTKARIEEDYLRILRFFRFYGRLAKSRKIDGATLAAIQECASLIEHLSPERITTELFKILQCNNIKKVWPQMESTGVLNAIGLKGADYLALHDFVTMFPQEKNPLIRLACMYYNKEETFVTRDPRLRYSNKEVVFLRKLFIALERPQHHFPPEQQCYWLGKDVFMAALMIEASRTTSKETREDIQRTLAYIAQFTPPVFDVTGDDLMARGVPAGPELGYKLKELEAWWVEHDFPSKTDCLEQL